jgi:hypothetical protein
MFGAPKTSVSLIYKLELFLFQIESVDLALKLLDEYEVHPHRLHAEMFQMKGSYDSNLKPKKWKKKKKEKLKKMQEK